MGFGASSFGFRIQGFGLQVSGSRVSDSEYRVEVSRVFDALKQQEDTCGSASRPHSVFHVSLSVSFSENSRVTATERERDN